MNFHSRQGWCVTCLLPKFPLCCAPIFTPSPPWPAPRWLSSAACCNSPQPQRRSLVPHYASGFGRWLSGAGGISRSLVLVSNPTTASLTRHAGEPTWALLALTEVASRSKQHQMPDACKCVGSLQSRPLPVASTAMSSRSRGLAATLLALPGGRLQTRCDHCLVTVAEAGRATHSSRTMLPDLIEIVPRAIGPVQPSSCRAGRASPIAP
jgi:hypothetical protein